MSKRKRFLPLKNHKGIRKDTQTERYVARKRIGEKQYCKTFLRIADAIHWRRHFHPLLTDTEIKGPSARELGPSSNIKVQARPNGVEQRFTFAQVWELYQKYHFPTLEQQSIENLFKFSKNFFPELMNFKMQEINPEVLDAFMEKKSNDAKKVKGSKRHTFDNDLKCLKSLLNWYRENYDGMFIVPVLKRHFAQGIICKIPKRNTVKMTVEQIQQFLDCFDSRFWKDFAEIHFYMAGRSQEVGGLQWESIDFKRKLLRVNDVSIWGRNKKFVTLKEIPKNGEQRVVCLNGRMLSIFKSRWENRSKLPCQFFRESTRERLDFVFEVEGQPISYRSIQHHYNRALKKAGLFPKFRSTHILRKAMANIVRQNLGLDAAQAAGGWKTRDIVERIYTDAPNQLNRQAVEHVEKLVLGEKETRSTNPHLKLVQDELD